MQGEQNGQNVRSAYEIKQALLKRAIAQDRGPEMIARILKRIARVKELAAEDREILDDLRLYFDQPRSVQMLNALARASGSPARYAEMPQGHQTLH
ncbi:MAG: hypothetical protein H6868_00295 [Rhodospirillales bacterium]|nr:hypothetical protein [Rhodospirillales bacterium]